MTGGKRVLSVIVTYYPAEESLLPLLRSLSTQTDAVVIVDNTPGGADELLSRLASDPEVSGNVVVRAMGENIGVAAAHNVGVDAALSQGFDFLLVSDQDSKPSPDMVEVLAQCYEELQEQGIRVGCVCPEYFDETTQQAFNFQVHRPGALFYSRVAGALANPWVEIVTSISSGMLIPREALEQVGRMRDELFIDHVDSEWCHRARAHGFRLFGTSRTRLTHALGDAPFRVWFFGWHSYSEYSPVRLYYRYRNFMLLWRLSYIPLSWRIRSSIYWLGNIYAHCVFAKSRLANTRAILFGLLDGLLGRTGAIKRSL